MWFWKCSVGHLKAWPNHLWPDISFKARAKRISFILGQSLNKNKVVGSAIYGSENSDFVPNFWPLHKMVWNWLKKELRSELLFSVVLLFLVQPVQSIEFTWNWCWHMILSNYWWYICRFKFPESLNWANSSQKPPN